MRVDHGAVQPIEIVYGEITAKPFVPVFINCVAPPFTPVRRVRLLGEAVGRHLATLDKKVLLISSGACRMTRRCRGWPPRPPSSDAC